MSAKLLLVEDHEKNRAVLRRRLEKHGYTVIEAGDGAAAVAKTMECKPDLILMDLSLPVMDGVEAFRALAEMMPTPPPVIALTGTLISDVRVTCAEVGFTAYLVKPCPFADILQMIKDTLPSAGTRAA